jgi:hypothetical protein
MLFYRKRENSWHVGKVGNPHIIQAKPTVPVPLSGGVADKHATLKNAGGEDCQMLPITDPRAVEHLKTNGIGITPKLRPVPLDSLESATRQEKQADV